MADGLRRVLGRLGPLGLVLAAAGLGVGLLGLQSSGAGVSAESGGTVNTDRPGIDAHNSPAVAVRRDRPSMMAVADRIDTPRFSCSLHLSTDGGAVWRRLPVSLPQEAPNCYWPDVAFDGDGRLVVLFTATGGRFNQPVGVWLQRYEGEVPSGPATKVAGAEAFHAHFAVEGRRVVVAWVQAQPQTAERPLGFEPPPNPILVARSDDGGATFSPPVQVSEPQRRVAQPSVVIAGADGSIVVGALDLGDDVFNYEALHEGQGGPAPDGHWRIVAWRSPDGGASFGPPVVVADRLEIPTRVIIDLMAGPSFAADPRAGAVYAAWDAGKGDGRDVFVARSSDGGATWAPATRLEPRARSQFLPAVGVAPDGRVDVVFYDRSRDPDDVRAEVVVGSSWDGGRSFATTVGSDRRFDTRIGLAGAQGLPQLGNQLAVASVRQGFVAFWADTSAGNEATNLQDLAVTLVTATPARDRRWPQVAAGAVLVLAGVGLVAAARRRRRTPAAVG